VRANRRPAPAKINLALIVGPQRGDGKHEVATVMQRIDLADRVQVERAEAFRVTGFPEDELVRRALEELAAAAGVEPRWHAHIEKEIPVAAGLGGGSSDAATALLLANDTLDAPLPLDALNPIAARLGADVPFFLRPGPQLAEGDGTVLSPLELPQDYWIVLLLPRAAQKPSTGSVYAAFDARAGDDGWQDRRVALARALAAVRRPRDLAALPRNDLASSPLAGELLEVGAFRADVSGAGPVVYGLFQHNAHAHVAAERLRRFGRTWVAAPAWYG
jgi:4-diphosphocytidyl-2-C-methyl-D-erythritol kinase